VLSGAHGALGEIVNDWQLNFMINDQSGQPINYPNNYVYNCSGTYNIRPAHKSWGSYLNNSDPSCFSAWPEYKAITQHAQTTAVRTPWAEQSHVGLEKEFHVVEAAKLQFRAEAFNVTNTPIHYGPSTSNPTQSVSCKAGMSLSLAGACSGYGTVSATIENEPRELQMSLKLIF
jgi:hypothetical protein